MINIENYKQRYGHGDIRDEIQYKEGKFSLPLWLCIFILHKTGLKSRKKRHMKKRVKREFNRLILSGLRKAKE